MKKITLATFKKFLKENEGNLLIKVKSVFDGMQDMVDQIENAGFRELKKGNGEQAYYRSENTLGYEGVWLVGYSRDSFREIENGIEVYNCCGSFDIKLAK